MRSIWQHYVAITGPISETGATMRSMLGLLSTQSQSPSVAAPAGGHQPTYQKSALKICVIPP